MGNQHRSPQIAQSQNSDFKVYIDTDKLREKLNYYYIIHAERKDVDKLEIEIQA